MSRARVRPTREETRQRLFEAAAAAFAEHGIGGASVEAITAAGGLTRGAFYSNFASKDELITAMLADHVEQTARRHLELLARHRDPDSFVAALMAVDRSEQDPLGRSPLLHLELILHTARAAERRPELTEFLQARRRLIVDLVKGTELAGASAPPSTRSRWRRCCWRWRTAFGCIGSSTRAALPRTASCNR